MGRAEGKYFTCFQDDFQMIMNRKVTQHPLNTSPSDNAIILVYRKDKMWLL